MKNKTDDIEELFQKHKNNWDIYEPNNNHETEFLNKLKKNSPRKTFFIPLSIAASIVLFIGIAFLYIDNKPSKNLEFASVETQQTATVFNDLIAKEFQKINDKKSPENKIIIEDALKEIKNLDVDYQNIIEELKTKGENKLIIMALMTNLQTRISFLQNVLKNINDNEKIKTITDENTF